MFSLETFQLYLTMSPLYEEVLKILPKIIYIALQFYRYANKRSYNTTPVLQCKIIKNNTGNTLKNWWPTQFQIVINLQKWYIQIFFGEDGDRNPHHSNSQNSWLQELASDDGTCNQSGKPSTPHFPISSVDIITSIAYWQSLSMHGLQNIVLSTQFPNNNESVL